jgi:hypothetical protein
VPPSSFFSSRKKGNLKVRNSKVMLLYLLYVCRFYDLSSLVPKNPHVGISEVCYVFKNGDSNLAPAIAHWGQPNFEDELIVTFSRYKKNKPSYDLEGKTQSSEFCRISNEPQTISQTPWFLKCPILSNT